MSAVAGGHAAPPEVVVPANTRCLIPIVSERRARLLAHIRLLLREELAKAPPRSRTQTHDGRDRAIDAACGTCRGFCCLNAGDHAYIDAHAVRQVRASRLEADLSQLSEEYLSRVPKLVFEDSCIFHGCGGCALPRHMRSNVCNSYVCDGLSLLRSRVRERAPIQRVVARDERRVVNRTEL